MPSRQIAAKELSEIFSLLSHPDRIRIVEELKFDEIDVGSLAEALGLEPARISQHLRLLRAHKIVTERREGRHHYYHLAIPEMADWILQGLGFIEQRISSGNGQISISNIKTARELWSKRG